MRNLNSSTNKAVILLFDFIFALVLLAFDQFTKYLAIAFIVLAAILNISRF